MAINENVSTTDYASRIQFPDYSILAINWKNDNEITISRHDLIVNFFDVVVFLVSVLVTNWAFPIILKLGLVRYAKFGRNVSDEKLLKGPKFQGNNLYFY